MKTKVNPDFKFEFETDAELEKAQMTGYVPLCDIVRITFHHSGFDTTIDYPVKSRETYIKDLEKLNNIDDVEILKVYQDKWYYDINEYDKINEQD